MVFCYNLSMNAGGPDVTVEVLSGELSECSTTANEVLCRVSFSSDSRLSTPVCVNLPGVTIRLQIRFSVKRSEETETEKDCSVV